MVPPLSLALPGLFVWVCACVCGLARSCAWLCARVRGCVGALCGLPRVCGCLAVCVAVEVLSDVKQAPGLIGLERSRIAL